MKSILLKRVTCISMFLIVCFIFTGCAKPTKYHINPYLSKNVNSPELKYCNDATGHKRGTKPFIFGGTCCCTPDQELMDMYHADGFLLDANLADLLAEYEKRGIVLAHEDGRPCNNYCDEGPHIVFGGKCMAPPVPGTQNYENIAIGKKPTP